TALYGLDGVPVAVPDVTPRDAAEFASPPSTSLCRAQIRSHREPDAGAGSHETNAAESFAATIAPSPVPRTNVATPAATWYAQPSVPETSMPVREPPTSPGRSSPARTPRASIGVVPRVSSLRTNRPRCIVMGSPRGV